MLSHVQTAPEGVLGREVKTSEEVPALGKEKLRSMRQWGAESGGGGEPTVCSPYVTGKGCQIRLQPDEKVLIQGGSRRLEGSGHFCSLDFMPSGNHVLQRWS